MNTPTQAFIGTQNKSTRVRLSFVQRRSLANLIEAEYIAKETTDKLFAEYASAKLGFALNGDHVSHLRVELGIEHYRPKADPMTRLARIEARLAAIEQIILMKATQVGNTNGQ